ncbi:ABC transporter permease [Candidatus Wolfebacteria bacterium]|nr:ABC transporter permease [Candidatus Wolfebacteria bacterium]
MDPQKLEQPKVWNFEGSHRLRLADLFRLSLRVFRVRPLRTFLTILGISLGIGTVLFLVSLGYGLQYILIGKLAATEDSLITLEAFYPSESNLSIAAKEVDAISGLADASEVSPVAELTGEVKILNLTGLVLARVVRSNYFRLSGIKPDSGSAFTEGQSGVIVSNTTLKLLNLKEDESSLGKEVSLKIFYELGEDPLVKSEVKSTQIDNPLKIVGIVSDEFQPPFLIVPFEQLPQKPSAYQRIYIKAKDIDKVEILRDKLIEKGLLISARLDLVNQAKKILTIITVVLGVFGVTALLVSAIGMFNTMIIGFLERIFEVGIMKSIGASVQDIRNLFLMESLIMGFLGGVGGILVGILSGEAFNLGLNFLAKYLGGKPVQLFIYPPQFLVFIVVISAFVGIASGFWPARRAAQLSPKQAFKNK